MAESLHRPLMDVVQKCFLRCWEWVPVGKEIDQLSSIHRYHPVVREVLVTDLSHLGFLIIHNFRYEGQKREDDLSLGRERQWSVVWQITIDLAHLIDVIILHSVDEWLNQSLIDLESLEHQGGVLLWNHLLVRGFIDTVASCFDKLADLWTIWRSWRTHVSDIACYDTLTSHRWNHPI